MIRINVNVESKILPFDARQLRDDFDVLIPLAIGLSKQPSLNGVNLNPDLMHESFTQNQLTFRSSPVYNIAFFIKYANIKLGIKELPNGEDIPNFNVFYESATLFLAVVMQVIKHDQRISNSEDKLINKNNFEYIKIVLDNLLAENNKIINIMVSLKKENVIKAAIKEYESKLKEFSEFIKTKSIEYSNNLNLDGLKGNDNSIFNPNYDKIYQFDTTYHVDPVSGKGDWRCNQYFVALEQQINYPSPNKGYAKNPVSYMTLAEIKKLCEPKIPYNYDDIKTIMEEKILSFLNVKRANFLDDLTQKKEYEDQLKKLNPYENLIKGYAYLLGKNISFQFDQAAKYHLEVLKKIPASNKIVTDFNLAAEMPELISLQSVFLKIAEDGSKLITPYEAKAELFMTKIGLTQSLLKFFKKDNETNKSDIKSQSEKIDKTYSELKLFFQEIIGLSDDLREDLNNKPAKLEKLNMLLDKVNITQVPEDLNLDQLNENYCKVFCLDRYLKTSSVLYRDVMKGDPHMGYFVGELKELNDGEVQLFHC